MTLRTGQTRTRSSAQAGVTLIELILVMAILALIAAIAVPRFSGFMSGRKYDEEWHRFRGLLRYARNEAISRSVPVTIQFDPDTSEYGLIGGYGQRPVPEGTDSHTLPDGLKFQFPNDANIQDGKVSVTFTPDGTVDENSPTEIQLVETNGPFKRTLEQDPVWGYSISTDDDNGQTNSNAQATTKSAASTY